MTSLVALIDMLREDAPELTRAVWQQLLEEQRRQQVSPRIAKGLATFATYQGLTEFASAAHARAYLQGRLENEPSLMRVAARARKLYLERVLEEALRERLSSFEQRYSPGPAPTDPFDDDIPF